MVSHIKFSTFAFLTAWCIIPSTLGLRLGEGFPSHKVEEYNGFPDSQTFLRQYQHKSKPLKMIGAAQQSPAFNLWNDEYFLSMETPENQVLVESKKKENRKAPATYMPFKEFVNVYNETDQYMVEQIPGFLGKDVVLPGPLHCQAIYEEFIVDSVMWFSSGGTKSVLHTDSVANILCLFRGDKELVMVDPDLYGDKVVLDHPEGAYSGVDVDDVDFEKYPGLGEIEYYHVNLTSGDCLFIPYLWIHQVRSYNRNIAVNVWWDHHKSLGIELSACNEEVDPTLTLDKVSFVGFGTPGQNPEGIRDQMKMFFKAKREAPLAGFVDFFLHGMDENILGAGEGYKKPIVEVFQTVDRNGDGLATYEEILEVPPSDWEIIGGHMMRLEHILTALEERWEELHDGREGEDVFVRDEL